jgi:hypothetical protein
VIQQLCIAQACSPRRDIFLLLHFNKYNLEFHLKTLISESSRDETLTLVFKMLQQAQETPTTPREREIKYIRRSKRDEK